MYHTQGVYLETLMLKKKAVTISTSNGLFGTFNDLAPQLTFLCDKVSSVESLKKKKKILSKGLNRGRKLRVLMKKIIILTSRIQISGAFRNVWGF